MRIEWGRALILWRGSTQRGSAGRGIRGQESLRALRNASTNVIGIIANVLVSFTVTALSSVWLPR